MWAFNKVANTVVVFSARPAKVVDVIEVGLPWPCRRDDSQLVALRSRILDLLGNEQVAA
ncbi:hypothetical protein [Candidatus Pantoea formicae]|uniref:hypothetical protein n=1 Tax=Candidatus Pantoea formicae TaxID=2608355 RepID=UPI003ED8F44D